MKEVTLLIPTRNEAPSLPKLFDEIDKLPFKPEVLVADYKSTDGTKEIALERGARLFCIAERGKGSAIREAITYIETPYIITIDADGTYPVSSCETLLSQLRVYDVVLGCRTWLEKGSMSSTNIFGNFCLSLMASILYGCRFLDFNSGMWGFNTEALKSLNLTSREFTIEADYLVNCCKKKLNIGIVKVRYSQRQHGSKSKLMVWDGFKIGWLLIRKRVGK
jgi:glycosyltransferase involved in cell wall biosynthesis